MNCILFTLPQSLYRRTVFHHCIDVLFDRDWISAYEAGMEAKGPDGFLYRIYPYLQQYQGDLQEFATIALTRGHKGRQPCPKCHISASHATAEDLAKHHDSAPRQHVTLRNALRANVSQDFYKLRGMWGQRNAFFKATDNIYKALAVDPLHQFD